MPIGNVLSDTEWQSGSETTRIVAMLKGVRWCSVFVRSEFVDGSLLSGFFALEHHSAKCSACDDILVAGGNQTVRVRLCYRIVVRVGVAKQCFVQSVLKPAPAAPCLLLYRSMFYWHCRLSPFASFPSAIFTPTCTALADFLGADFAGLAFVPDTTAGVNAVLRSLDLEKFDKLLVTNHEYSASRNTLEYVAGIASTGSRYRSSPGPRHRSISAQPNGMADYERLAAALLNQCVRPPSRDEHQASRSVRPCPRPRVRRCTAANLGFEALFISADPSFRYDAAENKSSHRYRH